MKSKRESNDNKIERETICEVRECGEGMQSKTQL